MPSAKPIPETDTAPPADEREHLRDDMPDSPDIPDNPSQAELQVMIAGLQKAYKDTRPINWFRQWPTKYLIAALPMWWLLDCGLVKNTSETVAQGKFPPEVNQTEMAAIISKHFGIKVDKVSLLRLKKDKANTWIEPCWNGGDSGNKKWKPEITLRLWSENMGDKKDVASEAEDRRAILQMEREAKQIELDKLKRKDDATWMIKAAHDFQSEAQGHAFKLDKLDDQKRNLADLKASCKEAGLEDALIEKVHGMFSDKQDARFEEWQSDASDFSKKLREIDRQTWELSEAKKQELKVNKA